MFQIEHWDRSLFEFILAARPLEQLLEFETITTPTLLITGDDDNILGTDVNMSLERTMPNSRMTVIPECGHIPQEECPEEFHTAVIEFISDLR
jgi:pimeloyl-ACP methyl ester carboxylesterase